MENIPDHPVIRNCERYGYSDGYKDEESIKCPVCKREAETFYLTSNGLMLGCNRCIEEVDAVEWNDSYKEDI